MTFTEAALEVLRSAGEPLHYKKITELAIERNLLSHVGKTPEVTMSSRLAMMVKKDRGQAPIIKVKPGVFAIRESALQGQSLSPAALAAISEIEGLDESTSAADGVGAGAGLGDGLGLGPGNDETVSQSKAPAPVPVLPGADVFPEEEGDDDPILAGLEQETDASERAGRRRRRRRRRGKGDKLDAQPEVSARPEPVVREPSRERPREAFRERDRDRDRARGERDRHEDRGRGEERARHDDRQRDDRQRDERQRDDRQRDDRQRDDRQRLEEGAVDWNRQPAEGDLLGKDLADAVWHVLSRGDRSPHGFVRVAELLVRRGRLSGNAAGLAPTIAAAVRADISRAELQRSRPRFRLRGGRLSLAEWLLPKSLARAEQDLLAGAERYAAELRRALIQKLSELPTAGFAELLATWLNAEGVTALRAVRRPGSSGSELHFAGTRKSGSEEIRLAIVVQRSGRDIDREAVIDVRGALHHYGQAQSAWLVTLGRITSGAREEAAAQAAACALFDGNALASAMERLGVAMRRHVIAHHEIDYDLLESLGDSPEQRERREREEERERRQLAERMADRQSHERARQNSVAPAVIAGSRVIDDAESVPPRALRGADWDEESIEEQDEHADYESTNAIATKQTDDRDQADLDVEVEEDELSEADAGDVDVTNDELEPDAFRDEDDLDERAGLNEDDEVDEVDEDEDVEEDEDLDEEREDYEPSDREESDEDDADAPQDNDNEDVERNDAAAREDSDDNDDNDDSDDDEEEDEEDALDRKSRDRS